MQSTTTVYEIPTHRRVPPFTARRSPSSSAPGSERVFVAADLLIDWVRIQHKKEVVRLRVQRELSLRDT